MTLARPGVVALPEERFTGAERDGLICFGEDGDAIPTIKVYLHEARTGPWRVPGGRIRRSATTSERRRRSWRSSPKRRPSTPPSLKR